MVAGDPQAHLAAFGELLHNAARTAPSVHRAELRAAATAFNRATRNAKRADHQTASALRAIAKELAHTRTGLDGAMVGALLPTVVLVAVLAVRWHEQRGHEQQAEAAARALTHIRAAYTQAAGPHLAEAAQRTPGPGTTDRSADAVRLALPTHADRVLTDPAWPALATTLARAETAGHHTHTVLAEAAAQRARTRHRHPPRPHPPLAHHDDAQPPQPRPASAAPSATDPRPRPRPWAPITPEHADPTRRTR